MLLSDMFLFNLIVTKIVSYIEYLYKIFANTKQNHVFHQPFFNYLNCSCIQCRWRAYMKKQYVRIVLYTYIAYNQYIKYILQAIRIAQKYIKN